MTNDSGKSSKIRHDSSAGVSENTKSHEGENNTPTTETDKLLRSIPEMKSLFNETIRQTQPSGMSGSATEMQLRHSREAESRTNSRLLALTQEYLEQKDLISRNETTVANLQQAIADKDHAIKELNEQVSRHVQEIRRLETSSYEMVNAFSEARERNTHLTTEFAAAKERLQALEKDSVDLRMQLNCERYELGMQRDKAVEELERVRNEASAMQDRVRSEVLMSAKKNADAKITSVTETFEKKIAALNQASESKLAAALEVADKKLTIYMESSEKKLAFVSENADKKVSTVTESLEAKLSASETKLAVLTATFETKLAEKANELTTSQSGLQRKLAKVTDEVWAKDLELERLHKAELALTEQISALSQQMADQAKIAAKEFREATDKLNEEKKVLVVENAQANVEVAELRHVRDLFEPKVQEYKEEIKHLKAQYKGESEALAAARNQLSLAQMQIHHAQLETERQLAGLRHEYDMKLAGRENDFGAARENASLEVSRANQRFEMENERAKTLETRLIQLRREHDQALAQVMELREAVFAARHTVADVESAMAESERRGSELNLELTMTKDELKREKMAARDYEVDLRKESGKRAAAELEVQLAEKRAQSIKADAVRQVEKVNELEKELTEKETTVATLEQTIQDEQGRTAAIEADRQAKFTQLLAMEKQLQKTEERVEAAIRNTVEAQAEGEKLKADLNGREDARLERERTWKERLRILTQGLEREREQVAAKEEEINVLEKELQESEVRTEAAQARIQDFQVDIERLRAEFAAVTANHAERERTWKQRLKVFNNGLAVEREEIGELSEKLGTREQQLRLYNSSLNKEKTELTEFTRDLARELKMIANTHPLKDYIAATEFELSKVEVQLKTIPMLTPDRPKLEGTVSQLVEQREFLKGILAHAQKQFEQRAGALEKRAAGGFLAALPPPPPGIGKKSSKSNPKRAAATKSPLINQSETANDHQGPAAEGALAVRWASPMSELK